MNDTKSSIGFFGLLQLALIILKLCGVIHWTWFWVFTPLWVEIAIIVLVVVIIHWLRR